MSDDNNKVPGVAGQTPNTMLIGGIEFPIATESEMTSQMTSEAVSPLMVSENLVTPQMVAHLREKAAKYDELKKTMEVLEAKLHSEECHPDYLYVVKFESELSTIHNPPPGEGWMLNKFHSAQYNVEDGRLRVYWYRPAEAALHDDINPYDLPPVTLEPLTREELFSRFLEKSTSQVNQEYPEFPQEQFDRLGEETARLPSGYYRDAGGNVIFYMVIPGLEIFMNLGLETAMVRVPKVGCTWHDWFDALNVNTMELFEGFDLYA